LTQGPAGRLVSGDAGKPRDGPDQSSLEHAKVQGTSTVQQ
jgi:hypothetical protein